MSVHLFVYVGFVARNVVHCIVEISKNHKYVV